ncbi:MAG: hypothetical protein ACYC4H_14735, partial [Desulfocucumaceae bacterium]
FTLYSDYFVYVFMREFRGNTIIVAMNNGTQSMTNPLKIDIGSNNNIPARIKKNLASGQKLVNLLDKTDAIEYRDGAIRPVLRTKDARIYKLLEVL